MHYLVTGGAGFIGTHLSNYLISLGHQVSILDDMSFGDPNKIHPKANLIIGKIEDSNLCLEVTKNIDGVFHMAAFSRSGPSFDMPEQCHECNALGTLNILQACKKMELNASYTQDRLPLWE